VKYLISNQIAIQIALNIQERKYKCDIQLVFNDNPYFFGYESLNIQSIFGQFWASGRKQFVKKSIIDLMNLNYYFLTSALKTSFWASLKKFDFLAISWFSQYLGEAALKL